MLRAPARPSKRWAERAAALRLRQRLNRQDFGLTYMSNKLPGGDEMIGDLVAITLDVEMVQK